MNIFSRMYQVVGLEGFLRTVTQSFLGVLPIFKSSEEEVLDNVDFEYIEETAIERAKDSLNKIATKKDIASHHVPPEDLIAYLEAGEFSVMEHPDFLKAAFVFVLVSSRVPDLLKDTLSASNPKMREFMTRDILAGYHPEFTPEIQELQEVLQELTSQEPQDVSEIERIKTAITSLKQIKKQHVEEQSGFEIGSSVFWFEGDEVFRGTFKNFVQDSCFIEKESGELENIESYALFPEGKDVEEARQEFLDSQQRINEQRLENFQSSLNIPPNIARMFGMRSPQVGVFGNKTPKGTFDDPIEA